MLAAVPFSLLKYEYLQENFILSLILNPCILLINWTPPPPPTPHTHTKTHPTENQIISVSSIKWGWAITWIQWRCCLSTINELNKIISKTNTLLSVLIFSIHLLFLLYLYMKHIPFLYKAHFWFFLKVKLNGAVVQLWTTEQKQSLVTKLYLEEVKVVPRFEPLDLWKDSIMHFASC